VDDDARLFHRLPWEAVAVGRIAGYIFPALNSIELYRVAGKPVYLPHLVIGLALTALVTVVNYRGIRLSATFQNWSTFGTLALFVVFVAIALPADRPQLSAFVYAHSIPLHFAGAPDCAVLHDGYNR